MQSLSAPSSGVGGVKRACTDWRVCWAESLVGCLFSSAAERDSSFSWPWDGFDEEVTLNCPSFALDAEGCVLSFATERDSSFSWPWSGFDEEVTLN